ncbi:MAG: isoamylase early set domain-containing protein [Wenzhouxiangellaceae bacterium]
MLEKQYLADKKNCKVTFTLDHGAAKDAEVVSLVGDFNDWDAEADPMKRGKSGEFSKTIKLACGDRYQFRYVIDGTIWENDAEADDYAPSPFGSDNSVIEVNAD